MYLKKLLFITIAALTTGSAASTVLGGGLCAGIVSLKEMKAWVEAQDPANITLIGDPFGVLKPRNALAVTVTFCSTCSGMVCTGPCMTVTGSSVCLNVPNMNCISATSQVSFCNRSNCGGSCNKINSCGTCLSNNFCATPGTQSIGIAAGS